MVDGVAMHDAMLDAMLDTLNMLVATAFYDENIRLAKNL